MSTHPSSSPASPYPANPFPTKKVIPQSKGWPLMWTLFEHRRDAAGFFEQSWRQLGDIFQVKAGWHNLIVLSNPELARQVLIHDKQIFQRLKPTKKHKSPFLLALGLGLFTSEGESWLSRRRIIQPIFHRQRIHSMGEMMVDAGVRMLERWQQAGHAEIYLEAEMRAVTLDILNRAVFGSEILGEIDQIGPAVEFTLHYFVARAQNFFVLPASWPTPAKRRFQRAQTTLADLHRIIRQRRSSLTNELTSPTNPTRTPSDILDMLIVARDEESGEGMRDEEVYSELLAIYAGGNGTAGLALTAAWYALTQQREVLHKLQQEVDSVLLGRTPTMSDLPNLPYTLQVLEEALRLLPPIPATMRIAEEASELDGYPIPKGSQIVVSTRNIHHHPAYWERPEEFWPERFAPENKQKNQRIAYLPFLTGPHLCLGNHFFMVEGHLLLALMAQHFEMELLPDRSSGMKMRLVKRLLPAASPTVGQ